MKKRLEQQCVLLDDLLRKHNIVAYVSGGTVRRKRTRFDLDMASEHLAEVKKLRAEIQLLLASPRVKIVLRKSKRAASKIVAIHVWRRKVK